MKKIKLFNKKNLILLLIATFLILIILFYNKVNSTIPTNYIAIFNNNTSSEHSYQTYVYITEEKNYKYKYINVEKTTISWGNPKWKTKIVTKGKVKTKNELFKIAKKNNSYEYVTLQNNNQIYSIEEFKTIFLRD